ncbi:MAG: cation:proton antiporter [Acidobacteriota bacterium]
MPHLPTLLLQIAVVVGISRLFGWLFRRLHQPQVIGEMVAGISLGPSLLGWLAPATFNRLFPSESFGFLNAISQLGVVLFMFLVGLELNLTLLKRLGRIAITTSLSSILVPFVSGFLLALYIHPHLASENINAIHFAVFIGAAMSVTAFPVLARILIERNLFHTRIGALSIASAAVGDVMAWGLLAVSILLVRGSGIASHLVGMFIELVVFISVMIFLIRPLLKKVEAHHHQTAEIPTGILALIILLILASALVTEWIGIHALFGAFLAGAIMPKSENFSNAIAHKFEDVTLVLLLPIFFAFTGLKTTIGLLSGANLWGFCLLIIVIAILGKVGGATLAARASGIPWREASAVGVLLNTRGLVELVLLNIGLEAGILTPTVFTMMVLMALVTTTITTPLLHLIHPATEPERGIR